MVIRLAISTHDGRCGWARPVALVDRGDNNKLISCHRSLADAMRARVLLEQVGNFARDISAEELHELAGAVCERLYGFRDFQKLSLPRFNTLIAAIRTELLARRKR
jgi:hypothetical protein